MDFKEQPIPTHMLFDVYPSGEYRILFYLNLENAVSLFNISSDVVHTSPDKNVFGWITFEFLELLFCLAIFLFFFLHYFIIRFNFSDFSKNFIYFWHFYHPLDVKKILKSSQKPKKLNPILTIFFWRFNFDSFFSYLFDLILDKPKKECYELRLFTYLIFHQPRKIYNQRDITPKATPHLPSSWQSSF